MSIKHSQITNMYRCALYLHHSCVHHDKLYESLVFSASCTKSIVNSKCFTMAAGGSCFTMAAPLLLLATMAADEVVGVAVQSPMPPSVQVCLPL
jgi:hypothetical protein